MIVPQFVGVSADKKIDLQSLVPQGDEVIDTAEIKVLNKGGVGVEDYIWTKGKSIGETSDCWADEDQEEKIEGKTFTPGTGLWVYGEDEQALQSSGQVELTNDIIFNLRQGAIGCGNPYPVEIDLQDILPEGDEIIDTVEIKVLNKGGVGVEDYIWTKGKSIGETSDCWADEDQEEKIEGRKVLPGEGLWVYGEDGQTLRFPVPSYGGEE